MRLGPTELVILVFFFSGGAILYLIFRRPVPTPQQPSAAGPLNTTRQGGGPQQWSPSSSTGGVETPQSPGTGKHPPGWHPDPWGQSESRWWDGTRWTDQTQSSPPPPPPPGHQNPYGSPQPLNQAGFYQPAGAVVPRDVNRVVAALLALLLGGLGIHKFYCKKTGLGILYLAFFWTFIPAFIGLIEGIIYLVQDDEKFAHAQGLTYAP